MDESDELWTYSTMAWGSNGWKSSMQNNLGDIFIVDPNIKEGTLICDVSWENENIEAVPWGLQFISKDHPELWTQVPLRGKRKCTVQLPAGKYFIRSALTAKTMFFK